MPHGSFRTHHRALEGGREESGPPVVRAVLRHTARIGNGDIGWQVAAHAAERVGGPGTKAGKTIQQRAGRKEILAGAMGVGFACEGMDEGDVVGQPGEVGNQVADPLAGIPMLAEPVLWPREISSGSLEGHRRTTGKRFAVPFDEFGFVIPRFELAHRTGAEDDDDVFRLGREMRAAREIGIR